MAAVAFRGAMLLFLSVRLHLRMLGIAGLSGNGGFMPMMMPMIAHMPLSCRVTPVPARINGKGFPPLHFPVPGCDAL
jgi:hypothetical protein